MDKTEKLKVAVLFGGCSSEYAISLQSAYAVLQHLDGERYLPVPIGITRQGQWMRYEGGIEKIPRDTWLQDPLCHPVVVLPGHETGALMEWGPAGPSQVAVDVALPMLHGKNGEDGTVQGLLELAGIPYAGCGVLSSALGMDKDLAHRMAAQSGVAVPRSRVILKGDRPECWAQAGRTVGYPLFCKPARGGSSLGITQVENPAVLASAVREALEQDDKIVLEAAIPGFEVGCAILGRGDTLTMGVVDEIELEQGFLDYGEKYHRSTAKMHTPARLDADTAQRIQNTAAQVYRALDCRGFARVDLFLTPKGEIVFNEVNTLPGMTAASRFPKMLEAVGISFSAMLDQILSEAVCP